MTIALGPLPIAVQMGEHTAEALRQAQIAASAALAAAAAADAAGESADAAAASGPSYPSQAAGEALSATGVDFTVAPGDGTLTKRKRTVGGSDFLWEGPTMAEVGLRTRVSIAPTDFIAGWALAATGVPIRLKGAYTVATNVDTQAAVSAVATGNVDICVDGDVTVTYTGATHVRRFLRMIATGFGMKFTGPGTITINANNKANMCLDVQQLSGAVDPDFELGKVRAHNAFMATGATADTSAVGGNFQGKGRVSWNGAQALNIGRAAGTGAISARGTFGFVAAESGALYPTFIDLRDMQWNNIFTADAVGDDARVDCDGVNAKVAMDTGHTVLCGNSEDREVMGRAIKVQGLGANVVGVGPHRSWRSSEQIKNGTSIIDLQTERGDMRAMPLFITLSGDGAVNNQKIWGKDISPRTAREPFDRHYGDVYVDDQTTGGNGLWAAFAATPDTAGGAVGGGKKHVTNLGKLVVRGRAVRHFVDCGNTGSMAHTVNIEGLSGAVSNAIISVGAAPPKLTANFTNCHQTGAAIPAVKRGDGAGLGLNWGKMYGRVGDNIGIWQHDGNNSGGLGSSLGPSLLDPSAGAYAPADGDSRATLRARELWPLANIAAGATHDLGEIGLSGMGGIIHLTVQASTAFYESQIYVSGSTMTQRVTSNSFMVAGGSLSAAPVTPDKITIWRDTTSDKVKVTNTYATAQSVRIWTEG